MRMSTFPAPRALAAFLSVVAGSALLASVVPSGASAFEMQVSPGTTVTPTAPLAPKQTRAPLTVARAVAVVAPRAALVQSGTTVVGDGFSESATPPSAWNVTSGVCLTAGTSTTPSTSIPACGSAAPVDPVGQGALEMTPSAAQQAGMLVDPTPIATANGLQVTFSDYSFNGTTPGANGTVLFLTDASKPIPTAPGQPGGSLGYANANGLPGLANGYLGLALDEFGDYSNPTEGRTGGPGSVPETIAVRGAAAATYPYLGGATVAGKAASLRAGNDGLRERDQHHDVGLDRFGVDERRAHGRQLERGCDRRFSRQRGAGRAVAAGDRHRDRNDTAPDHPVLQCGGSGFGDRALRCSGYRVEFPDHLRLRSGRASRGGSGHRPDRLVDGAGQSAVLFADVFCDDDRNVSVR
jgi:hypothetical protein